MSKRTMSEFVSIIQPIIDEYQNMMIEVTKKLNKDLIEKVPDMNESEALIFYTMITDVQKKLEKIGEE